MRRLPYDVMMHIFNDYLSYPDQALACAILPEYQITHNTNTHIRIHQIHKWLMTTWDIQWSIQTCRLESMRRGCPSWFKFTLYSINDRLVLEITGWLEEVSQECIAKYDGLRNAVVQWRAHAVTIQWLYIPPALAQRTAQELAYPLLEHLILWYHTSAQHALALPK